ncbi:MAG TPA: PIN-like domain-containing protein [Solirubrobacterales bacterium]|nr:PIN-like domain-containing protein [Solirubrobacterales bacterium]
MRERFPGHYRPSEDEFAELWKSALIVPDTNVLLTLYRLPETTRSKLLEILEKMKDRLFLPHQVGVEFQRNRLTVIDDQMATYAQVEKAIDGFAASVGEGLREHPRLDRKDIEARISDALAPVQDHLEELRRGHPDPLSEDPLGADVVRDALEPLLEGSIGEPRDLNDLVKEGRTRYERKVPPGWGDKKKPEPDCFGDLAIWFDVIDKAKAEQKPVIMITEERKPDWWWIRHNKVVGAQPQLIEEMREKAGQLLWIYGLQRFMEKAAEALGIEFNEDERDDVVRAETAAAPKAMLYRNYLSKLDPRQAPMMTEWDDSALLQAKVPRGNVIFVNPATHAVLDANQWWREAGINPGWVATVEPGEESALLRIAWQPRMIESRVERGANRLLSEVTDPSGAVAIASRRDTTLNAAFRYPDNFVGAQAAEPGTYSYSWRFSSADEEPTEEIASGEFEILGVPASD